MKRDRVIKLGVAVISISAILVGSSIAYFRAESNANNQMSSTNLGIALMEGTTTEGFTENSEGEIVLDDAAPGSLIDRELYVQNVKESPSYIRVTLTKYWEDSKGEKLPEKDASLINLVTSDDSKWIINKSDRNSEVIYMYYKLPVNSGASTDNFLDQIQIGTSGASLDNSYTNLNAKVYVEVDAIQQYAAQDAILAEWGLEVQLDDTGAIEKVVE